MNLPTPHDFVFPPGAVIAVPADGLTVYRLIRGDVPAPADFEPQPLARAIASGWPELIRLGLSHFLTAEQARAARARPTSRIAAVRLTANAGIHLARTGRRAGHVTVWARPETLLENAAVAG